MLDLRRVFAYPCTHAAAYVLYTNTRDSIEPRDKIFPNTVYNSTFFFFHFHTRIASIIEEKKNRVEIFYNAHENSSFRDARR